MDIKHGRRKTFDIEFVEVTENNMEEAAEWCGGSLGGEGKDAYVRIADKNAINTRQTKAFVGDIIVHSKDTNSFKSFGRRSFNKTFEVNSLVVTHRDAGTGKYVSEEAAQADPDGTVSEAVIMPQGAATLHDVLPHDADPS